MRVVSMLLTAACLAATIGVSVAHAREDGWRRPHEWREHEWREHHWRGEDGEGYRWAPPPDGYLEGPPVYYGAPPVYYEPAPSFFGLWIGHGEDDEE